ncbi:hypothetical protein [Gaoshiqia sediminis]|uniref:PQQ-like beta-propeller repeat protein n=1 Tax=Gaoshiqia sediminis TaxID=2986998 RepID=A0AA41YB41_9BACT|nr:hypothetical protein [Gaoshiqia sediminis]MCW0484777.1 PQQ-like beta-propeller repeat protein [Gaoshiqia sediminis]
MKNRILVALIGLLVVLVSCERDDNHTVTDLESLAKAVIIQRENLEGRVSNANAGVVATRSIASEVTPVRLKSVTLDDEDLVSDLPLVLIAEVAAPEFEGNVLRATHVVVSGNYAYVSYNFEEEPYLGAVDVIDISDPYMPQLAVQAIFPNMDISSLYLQDQTLYMAGANKLLHEDGTNPAVLIKMNLDQGFLTEDVTLVDMPGYVGTGIIAGENSYYGVSGDNGVLASFSKSGDVLEASINLADLRDVGMTDNRLVVLSGTEGIHIFDAATLSPVRNFETSQDVRDAKRTIDFYVGSVLAAEGFHGVGIYDLASGEKRLSIPVSRADGLDVDPNEVVSNAVSVNEGHIFVANGAAGVGVLTMKDGEVDQLVDFVSLALPGSANYVRSAGDYVFVADGFGGLQILKMVTVEQETAVRCEEYPEYDGKKNLTVNSGEELAYSSSASLDKVEVNASLVWCGALSVSQHLVVNTGGTFTMIGSLAQGTKNQDLIINGSGTLRIEGSLVVYGDLVLNSNSTLEFMGSGSSITVYGEVRKGDNVNIIGDFNDTNNSLN